MEKPLLDWLDKRSAGVLIHPSSLPSQVGIGNFGNAAYRLIDWLKQGHFKYWQICPIGPTGYGDSPYQSFSAFAGNPYFIDLEAFFEYGLLNREDLQPLYSLPKERVDYGGLYQRFWPILRLVHRRFKQKNLNYLANYGMYEEFKAQNAEWLEPYAYFMACKAHHNGKQWSEWAPEFKDYQRFITGSKPENIEKQAEAYRFFQYVFAGQWTLLREYARQQGIEIIGDIPIFVSYDSADVWSNCHLFQLDKELKPTHVAGVPPDYFSPDGQLWGNPLFNWDAMKKDGYAWWIKRLKHSFGLYDVIRLDHFRGFEAYWSIPSEAKTAKEGTWEKGPDQDFFRTVQRELPDAHLIAEDLGEITTEVEELIALTGMPNMAILQFAFDGNPKNSYVPFNINKNTVVYTGSHDNDTTRGWYEKESPETQDRFRRYFRVSGEDAAWDLIRAALASSANVAIIPMQDILNLGSEARMNTPGQAAGNWQWRMTEDQLEDIQHSAPYLAEINQLYGRVEDEESSQ